MKPWQPFTLSEVGAKFYLNFYPFIKVWIDNLPSLFIYNDASYNIFLKVHVKIILGSIWLLI